MRRPWVWTCVRRLEPASAPLPSCHQFVANEALAWQQVVQASGVLFHCLHGLSSSGGEACGFRHCRPAQPRRDVSPDRRVKPPTEPSSGLVICPEACYPLAKSCRAGSRFSSSLGPLAATQQPCPQAVVLGAKVRRPHQSPTELMQSGAPHHQAPSTAKSLSTLSPLCQAPNDDVLQDRMPHLLQGHLGWMRRPH